MILQWEGHWEVKFVPLAKEHDPSERALASWSIALLKGHWSQAMANVPYHPPPYSLYATQMPGLGPATFSLPSMYFMGKDGALNVCRIGNWRNLEPPRSILLVNADWHWSSRVSGYDLTHRFPSETLSTCLGYLHFGYGHA